MLVLWIVACGMFNPGPEPEKVVIVRGDTLGKLAKKHGVTVDELMTWNGLTSDRIEVGQVLVLLRDNGDVAPAPRKPRPGRPRSTTPASGAAEAPDRPTVPTLPFPSRKSCLSGPDGAELGDEGSVASQGLSYTQAKSSMDAFLPKIGTCLVALDPVPTRALDLAIQVGCDGRVDGVTVEGRGDWPAEHARCIAEALKRASFPAHALPDGDTFRYPLRMQ